MASLIPGYEYDIFISYRQKDNKYDGWVSEFTDNLKRELEATFKEEISVYFDINPHDGLLETHDVDASLREKLKCVIFIPVISRTYCDPKSYAWEHEFKAFADKASTNKTGLRVRLPDGNFIHRVLPIRIYDLDQQDIKLYESVIGGSVRSIDFVYKEPGVNRPLTPEDDEEKNLNNTRYRNQINKTANAIKEIISALKREEPVPDEKNRRVQSWDETQPGAEEKKGSLHKKLTQPAKKKLVLAGLFVITLVVIFSIYKVVNAVFLPKTIAVIPFTNPKDDRNLRTLSIGSMDAIIAKLKELKKLTIKSRFSSLQYFNTEIPITELREKLKIDYFIDINLEGTEEAPRMWIGLTKAKKDKLIWWHQYDFDEKKLMPLFTEITETIADMLNVVPSPEEKRNIKMDLTQDPDAYVNYLAGNARLFTAMGNLFVDSTDFLSAIRMYDKAIEYDPDFALAYARRALARSWGYYIKQLNSTHIEKCWNDIQAAEKLNEDLPDVQIAYGFYYYYCKTDYRSALINFHAASLMDPEDYQPLFYMALVYRKMGDWEKSQNLIHRVIRLNPQESLYLTNIGLSYTYLHKYDSALIFHQKAIDANQEWTAPYVNKIQTFFLKDGNTARARQVLDSATRHAEGSMRETKILLDIFDGKYAEAMIEAKKSDSADYQIIENKYLFLACISDLSDDSETAGKYYDTAIFDLKAELINKNNNPLIHGSLGLAYAGKENENMAILEGKKAIELTAVEKDKMEESDMRVILAQIYVMLARYDDAIKEIEILFNEPSCLSINLMELDPVWKPLLNYPGFKTLRTKYSVK